MNDDQARTANPGSRTSSGHHSDHHSDNHSDLTESSDDDENFIALLEYKDAFHILNLPHQAQGSSGNIPTETIQTAYDFVKAQVLAALDKCETPDNQSNRRNMLLGQQNYLELKLQALDQAYEELMPLDSADALQERQTEHVQLGEGGREQIFRNDAPTNAAVKSVRTEDPDHTNQTMKQHQPRRSPSEDELDVIDIYFRSSPRKTKSSDTSRRKSPDHQSEASSCTWDGSSVFSKLSRTKLHIEETSVGGLSDVLGPIYNYSPGQGEGKFPQQGTNRTKDGHSHRLPPSGINKEQEPRKMQFSPKSVTDFPAPTDDKNYYANASNYDPGKVVVGQGRVMKGPRHASARHKPIEATEAARMGILRALSEENSECLTDDEDINHSYLNISNETRADPNICQFNEKRSKARGFFQGQSDHMPKETNSLMASVMNENKLVNPARHKQSYVPPRPNRVASSKSTTSSTSSSRRKQNNDEHATSMSKPTNHDSLLQSEEYFYDAIMQSGMEFADEICMALNSCWKGDIGNSAVASLECSAASNEPDLSHSREYEYTHFTRSTCGDSTYHTQSVGTGADESTAFNTTSSCSRQGDSPTLKKDRKPSSEKNPSLITTASSDPPPRMLV